MVPKNHAIGLWDSKETDSFPEDTSNSSDESTFRSENFYELEELSVP